MKQEVILSTVCNQKGGIGKSTFTVLLASYIHYQLRKNCLVVDCDYPQWSINTLRDREVGIIEKSDYYKLKLIRQLKETGQKLWPIVTATPENALIEMQAFLDNADKKYEYVFFDMPGTVDRKGVMGLLAAADHVFVPMKADRIVMESTINFAKAVNEGLVIPAHFNVKGVHMFWTMVDRRERTPLYDQYDKALDIFGLSRMQSHIPYRSRFNKEIFAGGGPVFRSTLFPPDPAFVSDACLDELIQEILETLNPVRNGSEK